MNPNEFFKALSDPTRLTLVITLRDNLTKASTDINKYNRHCCQDDDTKNKTVITNSIGNAMCVCDLTELLGQPQPTVSRHLNHLKRVGILISERRGTWMWYSISKEIPAWCQQVIDLIEQ